MATATITGTDSPLPDTLQGAQWPDQRPRSHSTTSLPLSSNPSEMARRVSSSTVTKKKTKMKRLRTSERPSTAPGKTPPASPNHAQPPPPSAFTGKTGWLKRITSLRSSSTLALPDKDTQSPMEDTLPASSHSVCSSKDGYDVDKFGMGAGRRASAQLDDDFASTFTNTSKSKSAFGDRAGRDGDAGGGEGLYDFLQALEMAPPGQALTQPKPRPKGSVVKQAPPLIDLTGGVYMRRSVNRTSAVSPIRPQAPPPIAPFVNSSSSTESARTSATASTFTNASTLVDSPPRRSASESSSHGNDSPCSPSTPPPTALNETNIDNEASQIRERSAPRTVPVVLPITPKPKLATRKRAPSPPLQTARVPSATVPTSPPTSPVPRSVSSPVVPDSYLQQREQEAEEQLQRNVLAELLKESLGQLRTPPKAMYSSTSDPAFYLAWTTKPKFVLRAPPDSPEMQDEAPSPTSTVVHADLNAEDSHQPVGDQVSLAKTPIVEAVVSPVPKAALPRSPERAIVKWPRRQPQTPTTPTPPSPNVQLQSPIPRSSISFPSPSPPSSPKAASGSQSLPPSPPRPETPQRSPPTSTFSSPASTATEKPAPHSPLTLPRVIKTAATPDPLTSPSSRARDRNSDSAFTDSASIYEKTLAAISPEDIHISQRTLLEPVVRKASDVSLKQLFKQLDQTEQEQQQRQSSDAEAATPRLKKRSLNGITGAVVGGVVSASVGKKKAPKRPATAHAAVDLTKIKTPLASPILPGTSTTLVSGTIGSASARSAALSLGAIASSSSATSSARTPLSTRRPRTATEPHQQQPPQRLAFVSSNAQRAAAGKSLNMDWDRDANPWDDPTFRSEGSVFRDGSPSVPRSRAKSEAPPPVASALALGLAVKKEGKKLSLKRPSTADSGSIRSLLKKKSSQAFSVAASEVSAAPPVPAVSAPVAAPVPPPSAYPSIFKRSSTIRSKNKGQEKDLPPPPPAPAPAAPAPAATTVDDKDLPAISTDVSPSSFESGRILTMRDIYEASLIPVWDKEGHKVTFGKLFEDQVTIVIFIRHFWCPMCQDYMKSIVKELEPGRLAQARVKLVVIGCGDPAMIRSYNDKIIKSPFEMYTDPKLILFNALGMTLKSTDGGPEQRKGGYIKHGTIMGTLSVIGRALMSMAPSVLVKRGGDIKQLGGEFILGPGLRCRFAHRMSTTRDHAPIRDVAISAGVQLNQSLKPFKLSRTPSQEEEWTARRKGSTKKKAVRKSTEVDVVTRPPKAHVSSTVCGGDDDACPVRTNYLVGTI